MSAPAAAFLGLGALHVLFRLGCAPKERLVYARLHAGVNVSATSLGEDLRALLERGWIAREGQWVVLTPAGSELLGALLRLARG